MDRVWHLKVHLTVIVKCLVYVFQTRRTLNILGYRKAKTHGLSILDIGILSDDHYFELAEWHVVEGVEDQVLGREDRLCLILTFNELIGLPEGRLLEIVTQRSLPIAQF